MTMTFATNNERWQAVDAPLGICNGCFMKKMNSFQHQTSSTIQTLVTICMIPVPGTHIRQEVAMIPISPQ
jgi:hypothetical protein